MFPHFLMSDMNPSHWIIAPSSGFLAQTGFSSVLDGALLVSHAMIEE